MAESRLDSPPRGRLYRALAGCRDGKYASKPQRDGESAPHGSDRQALANGWRPACSDCRQPSDRTNRRGRTNRLGHPIACFRRAWRPNYPRPRGAASQSRWRCIGRRAARITGSCRRVSVGALSSCGIPPSANRTSGSRDQCCCDVGVGDRNDLFRVSVLVHRCWRIGVLRSIDAGRRVSRICGMRGPRCVELASAPR